MKNFGQILFATALTTHGVLASAAIPEVKTTEIKPRNEKGAINKLVNTGFLQPAQPIDSTKGRKSSRRLKKSKAAGHSSHQQSSSNRASNRYAPQNTGRTRPVQTGRGYSSYQSNTARHTDDWNDDYFVYYDDYPSEDDYFNDDRYSSSSKSGKKGSKKSSKKGSSDEDDFLGDDAFGDDLFTDDFVLLESSYEIAAFIDTRNIADPILVDPSNPNEFQAGTVNIYVDTPLWELFGVESTALIGLVQGVCERNDPVAETDPAYQGSGTCKLTLEALVGTEIVAAFTAEGPVSNDPEGSTLTVVGGLGEFAGVTGFITLFASYLDSSTSPPTVTVDDSLDFLSVADGFLLLGELNAKNPIDLLEDDDVIVDDDDVRTASPTDAVTPVPTTLVPLDDDSLPVGIVLCPGLDPADFCDCQDDCTNSATRCACEAAQACCGFT